MKSTVRTLAMTLLIGAPLAAQTWYPCPLNGHLYTVITKQMTWTTAQAEAVKMGGNLATVRSAAENQWIVTTFSHIGTDLWLGLRDTLAGPITNWEWVDGSKATFRNWDTKTIKQPSGDGPYVNMFLGAHNYTIYTKGGWNDWTPTATAFALVEVKKAIWTSLGKGCPCLATTPTLQASGGRIGTQAMVSLTNLPNNSFGLIITGLSPANPPVPFACGHLVTNPLMGTGFWSGLPIRSILAIPNSPIYRGLKLYYQGLVFDFHSGRTCLSGGLVLTVY